MSTLSAEIVFETMTSFDNIVRRAVQADNIPSLITEHVPEIVSEIMSHSITNYMFYRKNSLR